MRISAKARYGFAALIEIARASKHGDVISAQRISEKLGISKVFLDQVAASLKKAGIIQATKGPKGGYRLALPMDEISAFAVLEAVEHTFLEKAAPTVAEKAPTIEIALHEQLFDKLDQAVFACLSGVTIGNLLEHVDAQGDDHAYMLYM